jgi:hypothetical protein
LNNKSGEVFKFEKENMKLNEFQTVQRPNGNGSYQKLVPGNCATGQEEIEYKCIAISAGMHEDFQTTFRRKK